MVRTLGSSIQPHCCLEMPPSEKPWWELAIFLGDVFMKRFGGKLGDGRRKGGCYALCKRRNAMDKH